MKNTTKLKSIFRQILISCFFYVGNHEMVHLGPGAKGYGRLLLTKTTPVSLHSNSFICWSPENFYRSYRNPDRDLENLEKLEPLCIQNSSDSHEVPAGTWRWPGLVHGEPPPAWCCSWCTPSLVQSASHRTLTCSGMKQYFMFLE